MAWTLCLCLLGPRFIGSILWMAAVKPCGCERTSHKAPVLRSEPLSSHPTNQMGEGSHLQSCLVHGLWSQKLLIFAGYIGYKRLFNTAAVWERLWEVSGINTFEAMERPKALGLPAFVVEAAMISGFLGCHSPVPEALDRRSFSLFFYPTLGPFLGALHWREFRKGNSRASQNSRATCWICRPAETGGSAPSWPRRVIKSA